MGEEMRVEVRMEMIRVREGSSNEDRGPWVWMMML